MESSSSKRPAMLGSVIRDLVAPVLRECPPKVGIASITHVEVSPDLAYATIYVSALREPEVALFFLEGRLRELQRRMSELRMRKIPMLRFRLDRRLEKGNRIDELLREVGETTPDDTSDSTQA